MTELWLPVTELEGCYEISDWGNVQSLDREVPHGRYGTIKRRGQMLNPYLCKGYRAVDLAGVRRFVCHLVLESFVGPKPFPKADARHWDDDRINDNLTNLLWGTRSENLLDAVRNGHHNPTQGAKNSHAKLTAEDVIEIRRRYEEGEVYQYELAAEFKVWQGTIGKIINRQLWKHI